MRAGDGVLLVAHGTVENLDDLGAFLARIRDGRPAPPGFVKELRRRYEAIGGSPLLSVTRSQAETVAGRLGIPVFVGMRLWEPSVESALEEAERAGLERLCVIPLAPFSVHVYWQAALKSQGSVRANGQSHARARERSSRGGHTPHSSLPTRTPSALTLLPTLCVVLTAHSLPVVALRAGDPYERLVRESAQAIGEALARPFELAFQSQGEGTAEWLGPDLPTVLKRAREVGACPRRRRAVRLSRRARRDPLRSRHRSAPPRRRAWARLRARPGPRDGLRSHRCARRSRAASARLSREGRRGTLASPMVHAERRPSLLLMPLRHKLWLAVFASLLFVGCPCFRDAVNASPEVRWWLFSNFGAQRICPEMQKRAAPLRLAPNPNAVGRFFPEQCQTTVNDAAQTVTIAFSGSGFAWTPIGGRVAFTVAASVEYRMDFFMAEDAVYVWARPARIVTGPTFQVSSIEYKVANWAAQGPAGYLVNTFGNQIVSSEIASGFTVVHGDEGDEFALGILQPPLRPPRPFDTSSGRYAFANETTEVHPEQIDLLGPFEVAANGQALFARLFVRGPAIERA